MGGPHKEEFTPEELTALGEAEPAGPEPKEPEPGPEPKEPEPKEPMEPKTEPEPKEPEPLPDPNEQAAMTKMGVRIHEENGTQYIIDDTGTKIPAKRWKEMYGEYKGTQRELEEIKTKHDLFKSLGPEGYYQMFPTERPENWKPQEARQTAPSNVDPNDLKVQGGTYDGMTLRDVKQIDPDTAADMLAGWKIAQEEAKRGQQAEVSKKAQAEEKEVTDFAASLSKELFNIPDPETLTDQQKQSVALEFNKLLVWRVQNRKTGYSLEDSRKLMLHDELVTKAKEEGATGALKQLTEKKGPPSINTGGSSNAGDSGWRAMENMDEGALTAHIDKLNDRDTAKFFKDAPASLRKKHPSLPWD